MRKRRMRAFIGLTHLREGMSVLDLGGQPMIWNSVPERLNLTIMNLPGVAVTQTPSHHSIRYVGGDACEQLACEDRTFDAVFSNSVIEHVGPANRQEAFAAQVRRVGKSYWVQTPAKWFPIEAHCGRPFWWLYPAWLRRRFIALWRQKLPEWTEMVEETTVLSRKQMQRLFPEATMLTERSLGIPRSCIACFPRN